jgi:hypothetical protein
MSARWGALPPGEEKMGALAFVCPATGVEVSTGIEMDLATLDSLEFAKVYCPTCRQTHQMAGIRYWITAVNEIELADDDDARCLNPRRARLLERCRAD